MAMMPLGESDFRIYSKEITNEPMTRTWGSLYSSSEIYVTIPESLSGKAIFVTFQASGQITAWAYVGGASNNSVYCYLLRGTTANSISGTLYVMVCDV